METNEQGPAPENTSREKSKESKETTTAGGESKLTISGFGDTPVTPEEATERLGPINTELLMRVAFGDTEDGDAEKFHNLLCASEGARSFFAYLKRERRKQDTLNAFKSGGKPDMGLLGKLILMSIFSSSAGRPQEKRPPTSGMFRANSLEELREALDNLRQRPQEREEKAAMREAVAGDKVLEGVLRFEDGVLTLPGVPGVPEVVLNPCNAFELAMGLLQWSHNAMHDYYEGNELDDEEEDYYDYSG